MNQLNSQLDSDIIVFDGSTDQNALRTAGVISYVDVDEMCKILNRKVIYVEGAGAIPKLTLSYSENDPVLVCDKVCV